MTLPEVGDVWEHKERPVTLLVLDASRDWTSCLIIRHNRECQVGKVQQFGLSERHFNLLWRAG